MQSKDKAIMPVLPELAAGDYDRILRRPGAGDEGMEQRVRTIIREVADEGDVALRRLSLELDGVAPDQLEVPPDVLRKAGEAVGNDLKGAISTAASNIRRFHEAQLPDDVSVETMPGVKCSIRYLAIERVGLYIPGGSAPLLSTVLMTAIPATLAGCSQIIACTPPGAPSELLYALGLFNIRVFQVGGAQAIAAMALGTESIPRVDKVFGPGNAWVTAAKMQLAARGLAIDMPAGPSELMVIADSSASPAFVAADLLSQAEHGPDSQVILLSDSMPVIEKSLEALRTQLEALPRRDTARRALEHGLAIRVRDMEQALEISRYYGPEHLVLAVREAGSMAERVTNAGSVFLGHHTPESAGDYASGTNHTLPTGGATRGWSGITTASFMKSITFQEIARDGLIALGPAIVGLARAEQLEGHAQAVLQRLAKTVNTDKPGKQ